MRMTEYPEASAVASSDVLIIDGQDGNRKLPASKALEPLLKHGTSTNGHRVIPECNFLGNAVTNAQAQAIYDGSFDGLHVGDYWTISGYNWRIWDFDVWYGQLNNPHHIVIMPDTVIGGAGGAQKMNDTATTAGGYVGSKMYTTNLNTARNLVNSIFGDLVFGHDEYCSNAVTNGVVSGGTSVRCTTEIPSETMLYGCKMHSSANSTGSNNPNDYDATHHQFLLAQLMPEIIHSANANIWLRDIHSGTAFCMLYAGGAIGAGGANADIFIRPYFALKGRIAG